MQRHLQLFDLFGDLCLSLLAKAFQSRRDAISRREEWYGRSRHTIDLIPNLSCSRPVLTVLSADR